MIVRCDKGGEYYDRHGNVRQLKESFAKYLKDFEIVAQLTMPGSHKQNGVAEKCNSPL